jgi:phosphoribosylformylglycinamidine cyclo-ligase
MEPGEFDLVGFAVGVAERGQLVTGERLSDGDVLIGLPSPNLRSNGYSLARRVLLEVAGRPLDGPAYEGARTTLGEELLSPSVIYAPAIVRLLRAVDVRSVAHITGGGIEGNLSRVLHEGCDAIVHRRSWETPRIFSEIQQLGGVSDQEMARVFNLGIGMVVAVPPSDVYEALDLLRLAGHQGAVQVGEVVAGTGRVHLVEH